MGVQVLNFLLVKTLNIIYYKEVTVILDNIKPRDRIIREVMGRYSEVTPVAKVSDIDMNDNFYDGFKIDFDLKRTA